MTEVMNDSEKKVEEALRLEKKHPLRKYLPSFTNIENTILYFQYFALLLSVRVPWPESWRSALSWLGAFLLDYRVGIPNITRVDFRAHFMIIGCAVPVTMAFIALISFRSFWIVLWYAVLLVSMCLVIVGVAVRLLSNDDLTNQGPSLVFFVTGCVLAVLCILVALGRKYYQRQQVIQKIYDEMSDDELEDEDEEDPDEAVARIKKDKTLSAEEKKARIAVVEAKERERVRRAAEILRAKKARNAQLNRSVMESDSDDASSGGSDPGTPRMPGARRAAPVPLAGATGPSSAAVQQSPMSDAEARMTVAQAMANTLHTVSSVAFIALSGEPDIDGDPLAPKKPWETALVVGSLLAFLAAVIYALVAIQLNQDVTSELSGPLRDAGTFLCVACIIAVVLGLALVAVGQTARGRRHLLIARVWWSRKFTVIALFFLAVMHMPIMNTLLAAWSCHPYDCPAGSIYPDKDIRLDTSAISLLKESQVCVPCSLDTGCPSSISEALCTNRAEDRLRLTVDPSLSCRRHILYYFTPASVVMVIGFNVGLLLFYWKVVHYSVHRSRDMDLTEVPHVVAGHANESSQYATRSGLIRTRARHLYTSFAYDYRYTQLLINVESILLIAFAIFVRDTTASLSLQLVVHVLHFAFHATTRYYNRPGDNWYALSLRACLVIDACFSIAMSEQDGDVPLGAVTFVLILNCVIPLLGAAAGYLAAKRLQSVLDKIHAGDQELIKHLKGRFRFMVLKALASEFFDKRLESVRLARYREVQQRLAAEKAAADAAAARTEAARLEEGKAAGGAGGGAGGASGSAAGPPSSMPPLHHLHAPHASDLNSIATKRMIPPLLRNASVFMSAPYEVVKTAAEVHQDHLVDKAATVSLRIDRHTTAIITLFFMSFALFSFVAFSIVLIGIVRGSTTSLYISQQPSYELTDLSDIDKHDFALYGSWPEMMENCCCTAGPSTFKYTTVENWRCLNSYTKMKARIATLSGPEAKRLGGSSHSGLSLRGFCQREFNPGVCKEPFYELPSRTLPDDTRLEFNFHRQDICTPSNYTEIGSGASDYAIHRLW